MAARNGTLIETREGMYVLRDIFGVECGLMWKNEPASAALLYMADNELIGHC